MTKVFRVLGILVAILIVSSVIKGFEHIQMTRPFNTLIEMRINTGETQTQKKVLIDSLNEIAISNYSKILKTFVGEREFETNKDIVWFGTNKPSSNSIIVNGDSIKWLRKGMKGELIHSTNMKERPLSGSYQIDKNDNLMNELSVWAKTNNITISFHELKPFSFTMNHIIFKNPIGNALIASIVLFFVAVLSLFTTNARNRSIKLLAGLNMRDVLIYDIWLILSNFLLGVLFGITISLMYVSVTRGLDQVNMLAGVVIKYTIIISVLISIIVGLLSFLLKPKAKHIANREIPMKEIAKIGLVLKSIAMFLAIFIIPMTVVGANMSIKVYKEHAVWDKMKDIYRFSIGTSDDELYTEQGNREVKEFLEKMQESNSVKLSMAIDKSIDIADILKKAGFKHLVLVDKGWVDSIDVGIDKEKTAGKLTKVNYNDIDERLRNVLDIQMPLLFNGENTVSQKLNYYTYSGDGFLSLAPNTGLMEATLKVKNPLVVLVNDLVKELKMEGFILPAISSGNILFSNIDTINGNLNNNSLKNNVVSIDGIADLALKTAQDFRNYTIGYIVSSLMLTITMIFTIITAVKLWVNENKKKIFILHSNGKNYKHIYLDKLVNETIITTAIVISSAVACYLIRRIDVVILISIITFLLILQSIVLIISFELFSRKNFYSIGQRKE